MLHGDVSLSSYPTIRVEIKFMYVYLCMYVLLIQTSVEVASKRASSLHRRFQFVPKNATGIAAEIAEKKRPCLIP